MSAPILHRPPVPQSRWPFVEPYMTIFKLGINARQARSVRAKYRFTAFLGSAETYINSFDHQATQSKKQLIRETTKSELHQIWVSAPPRKDKAARRVQCSVEDWQAQLRAHAPAMKTKFWNCTPYYSDMPQTLL